MRVRRVTHGERRQKQVGPRARLYVCRYVSLYIRTIRIHYGCEAKSFQTMPMTSPGS